MNRLLAVLWVLSVAAAASAGQKVELTIARPEGVRGLMLPVTSGVPIPRGALKDIANVRLIRDSSEVPAQFRVGGLWRGEGKDADSIRWLLVDFQDDATTEVAAKYVLEFGQGVARKPVTGIDVKEDATGFTVRTGAAVFRVSKERFSLFDKVELVLPPPPVSLPPGARAEQRTLTLVDSPAADKARFGALLRGVRPMVTRIIPAGENTGKSHLVYVKQEPGGASDDYTLTFTTDADFELAGAKSGKVGQGAYQKDFKSTDGRVTIPADAWLPYARPKKGDRYIFRTLPNVSDWASEGLYEAKVVESGQMRTVIRVKGSFGPADYPVLEFTAWYHFYAQSTLGGMVKLAFTLENNNHGGRTGTGNAANANIDGINCVFFDEMKLTLPTRFGDVGPNNRKADVAVGSIQPALASENVELYQDSFGPKWDRYKDPKFNPRPNSYVSFKGAKLFVGDREGAFDERSAVRLDRSGQGGLTVAVRDFRQNAPKSLASRPAGEIEVGLFPGRYAGDFSFRTGEHKTHEVMFLFHRGGEENRDPTYAAAVAFSDPLRAEPPAEWFAKTGVFGGLHPFDERNYAAYETRNLSAIGVFPQGEKPGPSIFSRIEENNFYGWMDYGDVPIDFESSSGQWNLKYDLDYHMAQQWARTLRPQWWQLFSAAARHASDIDIHHQPHLPGLHFVKGGNWPHSLHNEPGHKNPHRNYNHFSKDLSYATRGPAAYYYLTGDWKAHEACLERVENAMAQFMSPQSEPNEAECNRMGVRGDAGTLERLIEGYLLTGDEKFLTRARWQIKSCAFDGKPARHAPTSLWSSLFYMMALARYVELFPSDEAAKGYLLAHIETLRKSWIDEHGIYYTITPQPDGSVKGEGKASHYNVMAADVLAIGYRMIGDAGYMEIARKAFDYGVKNACWENGPPTYFHVHGANGAMHGNVFLAAESAMKSAAASK